MKETWKAVYLFDKVDITKEKNMSSRIILHLNEGISR